MEINFTNDELLALREWDVFLKNFSEFVRIGVEKGIRFEVYTNEQSSHHRPHLHVKTSSASLSIDIDDGTILAQTGKISPSQRKQASKWMMKNKELVISKWNEFSNGFAIPID